MSIRLQIVLVAAVLACRCVGRLLFWTSVGRYQHVESSLLDGTSRRSLVSARLLSLSSLAVDWPSRRVFWADARTRRLESAAYDGSSRRVVVERRLQVPAAVAVHGAHVYWVDDGAQTVERADKLTGVERVVVRSRLTALTDIIAVARAADDRCAAVDECARLRCSHVCVVDAAAVRCGCPPGLSIGADSLTCAPPAVGSCPAEQVRCGPAEAARCVRRCDGVADCQDAVDEAGCYGSCRPGEFQCLGARRCVPAAARCDGRTDCDDASDEARCARCVRSAAGAPAPLLCRADRRCVGRAAVCDGRADCSDAEDERHCPPPPGGPHRAAGVVVGSVCALLVVVLAALAGAVWRRRRRRAHKSLDSPALSSKHVAVIAGVASSCRGGSYGRVPPAESWTSSSSGAGTSVSSVPLHHYYPRGAATPLNPPPSLRTTTSACSSYHAGAYSYSAGYDLATTPCSTDVCDDLDSAAALTEPLYRPPPPPPTPSSRCAADDEPVSTLDLYETSTCTGWCYDDCEHYRYYATSAASSLRS